MIKKLNVKNKILACILGCTLITETGCSNIIDLNYELFFGGKKEETTERYYDIVKNGTEYFVDKGDLGEAIPDFNSTFYIGLRNDENGNTVIVDNNEKLDTDDTIICMKTHASNDNYPFGIYISGVDSVELKEGNYNNTKENNIENDSINNTETVTLEPVQEDDNSINSYTENINDTENEELDKYIDIVINDLETYTGIDVNEIKNY